VGETRVSLVQYLLAAISSIVSLACIGSPAFWGIFVAAWRAINPLRLCLDLLRSSLPPGRCP